MIYSYIFYASLLLPAWLPAALLIYLRNAVLVKINKVFIFLLLYLL